MTITVHWSSCKHPLFLLDFNKTQNCLTDFRKKNYEIQNFMKIRSARAVPFYSYGQTDVTKVTVSFRNSAQSIYQLTLLCPNHIPHLPTAQAVHFIVSLIMAL
jgi:hypothetical protein